MISKFHLVLIVAVISEASESFDRSEWDATTLFDGDSRDDDGSHENDGITRVMGSASNEPESVEKEIENDDKSMETKGDTQSSLSNENERFNQEPAPFREDFMGPNVDGVSEENQRRNQMSLEETSQEDDFRRADNTTFTPFPVPWSTKPSTFKTTYPESGQKDYIFSSVEYYSDEEDLEPKFNLDHCKDAFVEIILEIDTLRKYDVACERITEWRSLD